MTLLLIAIAIVVFIAAVSVALMRGSVGLLSKRLDESPELAAGIPDEDLEGAPINIEY